MIPKDIQELIDEYEKDPTFLGCWWNESTHYSKKNYVWFGFINKRKYRTSEGKIIIIESNYSNWVKDLARDAKRGGFTGYYISKLGKYYL